MSAFINLTFFQIHCLDNYLQEGDFNGSLIGNDIRNLESMKWNLRTQFDRDVVTHFEAQVNSSIKSFTIHLY